MTLNPDSGSHDVNTISPSPFTDLTPSLRYSPETGSPVQFIAFAGLQAWRDVPAFEWQSAWANLPANRLYVRDLAHYWYLRGLAGVAPNIDGCVTNLRTLLADRGIRRTASFGASTGGFAALLYGALLDANEVHAFSPVCFVPSRRLSHAVAQLRHGDWRMLARRIELGLDRQLDHRHRRLRPILQNDNGRTVYHIYTGTHAPDLRNIRDLQDLPRVTIHNFDFPHHNLVGHLRDTGQLAALIAATHNRLTPDP